MDQDHLLQHTIRDLQAALRTETIRADLLTDKVSSLSKQVAGLAQLVGRLESQNRLPAASELAAQPLPDPELGRLESQASKPAASEGALLLPPVKRLKIGAAASGVTKVSAVVDLRHEPSVVHSLVQHPSTETEESSQLSPYKPSPTPSDLVSPSIDYSPAASVLTPVRLPPSKYTYENHFSVGDYCTVKSVKPRHKGQLVYVTQLAGQYCWVLLSTGERIKKHGTSLEKIPPGNLSLTTYDVYSDLESVVFSHKEKTHPLVYGHGADHESDKTTPSRTSPEPRVQVDDPTSVAREPGHAMEKN